LDTPCVEAAFLRHVTEGKVEGRIEVTKDEEQDVRSYWMTLRKREDAGNCRRKH
jgi:hypothetical protein